jgi:hypothetical protein
MGVCVDCVQQIDELNDLIGLRQKDPLRPTFSSREAHRPQLPYEHIQANNNTEHIAEPGGNFKDVAMSSTPLMRGNGDVMHSSYHRAVDDRTVVSGSLLKLSRPGDFAHICNSDKCMIHISTTFRNAVCRFSCHIYIYINIIGHDASPLLYI